jgi:hypothetical protein
MRNSDAIFEDIYYIIHPSCLSLTGTLFIIVFPLDSLNQVGIQREQPPCIHSFFSHLIQTFKSSINYSNLSERLE